ncbi:dTDP-4-dehydrorhamnose reductase family protein [Pseudolabrys sp.]|uniref:dTDP-4-dehydrorhamnose reductase family protein n=1 Tax=Pseudolabrys sp. TaxID=1960880 RepID=UPI003D09B472
MTRRPRVLVLGASGLLGFAMLRTLLTSGCWVVGATRNPETVRRVAPYLVPNLISSGDLRDISVLNKLLDQQLPDVVVNCVAAPRSDWSKPEEILALFALLPKRLAHLCQKQGIRLVHFSSDGVFSGRRGNYAENDIPDADDIYGIGKILGEVTGIGVLTIRTSMLGPDPVGRTGLLSWFLAQKKRCAGYSRSIFSGLPTVEIARIVRDVILPRSTLSGIYHLASDPISKLELLRLIANQYDKAITIEDDPSVVINRSLDCNVFRQLTGYQSASWPVLIQMMYEDHQTIGV